MKYQENINKLRKYHGSYVYIIRFKPINIYKIGYSKDLRNRLTNLCSGEARELARRLAIENAGKPISVVLDYLLCGDGPEVIEKYLHYKLKDKLYWKTEYFVLDAEDIKLIESLKSIQDLKLKLIKNPL